jgi:hypothetical protein
LRRCAKQAAFSCGRHFGSRKSPHLALGAQEPQRLQQPLLHRTRHDVRDAFARDDPVQQRQLWLIVVHAVVLNDAEAVAREELL